MNSIVNQVFLIGKVADKPEIIHCQNGGLLAKFSLDVQPVVNQGSKVNRIKIHAWNELAQYCKDNLKPADTVRVEAQLLQSKWTDKKTGEPRFSLVVNACEIQPTANCDRDNEEIDDDEYADRKLDRIFGKQKSTTHERF